MKNILFIIALIALTSCETVVDVDLNTAPERLVIDANINWEKGTTGNVQSIILSKTTGYYNNDIPKVSNASVFITNSSNTVFDFIEEPSANNKPGQYTCQNFQPVLGETYTLTVISEGKTYTAIEKLMATPNITDIEQEDDLGLNNDQIGIKINYIDLPEVNNYYLIKTISSVSVLPDLQIAPDEYNQGNKIIGIYTHPDLKKDSTLNIKLFGISERYYNYMNLLIIAISGSDGPFQTTPTTVRGNIVNQTNPQEYALGYFRLGETNTITYIVE